MEIDYDTLFYHVDNFCEAFEPWYKKQIIGGVKNKKDRNRKTRLKLSEIITLLIAYHQSGYTCFKYYYLSLQSQKTNLFPGLVHYDRFICLIQRSFPTLACLLKSLQAKPTEYQFIDSTPLTVCHIKREKSHKVFAELATKGKTSTGWFFGFKLHVVVNEKGEIVRLCITPGNTSDTKPVMMMMQDLTGKLIGDKGYLSQKLFEELFKKGVTMITKIRKNMKNRLMALRDKMMLQKRGFIETIFSSIKSLNTFVHHRHRSPLNAFCHIFAGLIQFQFRLDKPKLKTKFNPIP